MMTITGGEYQGVEYGTMYDNNTIYNSADRYDDKNGLIGVVGYEQHKVDSGSKIATGLIRPVLETNQSMFKSLVLAVSSCHLKAIECLGNLAVIPRLSP